MDGWVRDYYTVYGIATTCVIVPPYHVLRHIPCYIDDKQPHHKCQLMTIGVQVRSLMSWHEYAQ